MFEKVAILTRKRSLPITDHYRWLQASPPSIRRSGSKYRYRFCL